MTIGPASLPMDVPVELSLLAVALLAHGSQLRVVSDDGSGRLMVSRESRSVAIGTRSGSFEVISGGAENGVPWFMPVRLGGKPSRSGRLRIGIAGGADHRRLRMSWKTIAELRARGVALTSIVIGDSDRDFPPDGHPDEVHVSLDAAEIVAALRRLDLFLECSDRFGEPTFLAVAARDAGIPVVVHADLSDLSRHGHSRTEVWSADGFAAAVQNVDRVRVEPIDPRVGLSRLLSAAAL